MSRVEVQLGSPARGGAGKFSGVRHAFAQAEGGAAAALRKYALFDDVGNPAELLAQLFRSSNFGYVADRPREGRNTTLQDFTWGRETGFFTGGGATFARPGV